MPRGARPFRDTDTLRQIVRACGLIEAFRVGLTFDAFAQDAKVWSATQYQILVIGEAAHRLSDAFLALHADIPWKDIQDMRNVLAHAYDLVRLDIVWHTATVDIPQLRARLLPLLAALGATDDPGIVETESMEESDGGGI
ncbi:MAG: HepT-like ribonuclease domain-containing protein [Chloroflexota bacterium]